MKITFQPLFQPEIGVPTPIPSLMPTCLKNLPSPMPTGAPSNPHTPYTLRAPNVVGRERSNSPGDIIWSTQKLGPLLENKDEVNTHSNTGRNILSALDVTFSTPTQYRMKRAKQGVSKQFWTSQHPSLYLFINSLNSE